MSIRVIYFSVLSKAAVKIPSGKSFLIISSGQIPKGEVIKSKGIKIYI